MKHDEKLKMVTTMRRYGGCFVKALAECFVFADESNLERLYAAFPEIVIQYRRIVLMVEETETETDAARKVIETNDQFR